jgi:NTP pyrophosphatase (non-canonical NTP hydrolase)
MNFLKLKEYQDYIHVTLIKVGFHEQNVNTRLALLIEEVGKLAIFLRKFNDVNSKLYNLSEELEDVFFVLLSIANKYCRSVLEKRKKEYGIKIIM